MVIATFAIHSRALGLRPGGRIAPLALLPSLLVVLLVADCKGTSVTGGWGNRVGHTGRAAGSGMEPGGSSGGY